MIYDPFYIKLLYFTCFASYGILSPYLPVFYEELRMTKSEIGILSMIPNVSAFAFAPMWSVICDTFKSHNQVMIISLVVSAILFQIMNYLSSFKVIFGINLSASFFRAPMIPLLDSFVMSSLPDKREYGNFRLWGAVSFGFAALIGGFVTSQKKSGEMIPASVLFQPLFLLATLSSIISGFIVISLVNRSVTESRYSSKISLKEIELISNELTSDKEEIEEDTEEETDEEIDKEIKIEEVEIEEQNDDNSNNKLSALSEVFHLIFIRNSNIPIFSIVVLLSGFGGGVIDAFLFLRLKQLGGSGYCMGVARIITCLAEIPMFQVAGLLQEKYGTWKMLAATQMAFVTRFLYYSMLVSPWWVLPCEVLHGLTFATTWSVSCTFASEVSPPGANATMQAILEGLHFGLGSGLGALVGGFIYDEYGAVFLFQFCASLSFLASMLAVMKAIEVSCRDSLQNRLRVHSTPIPTSDVDDVESLKI